MPPSPRRASPTTRSAPTTRAGVLAVATASALLLAGCASIDEDDVRAIGDLPGIDYALSSCDLADCRVTVRAEPDVSAEQLLAALSAARETEPDVLTLDSDGTGGIEIDGESPADDDEAAVELAVEGVRVAGVDGFSVEVREDGVAVTVSGDGSRPVWDVAEELWPDVEPLASPALTVSQGAGGPTGDARPSRVVADGDLPAEGIALVRSVEEQDVAGYTGAVVTGDGVVLGARGVAQAEELEGVAAREAPGLDVEVVVSTNVLDQRPGSGGEDGGDEGGGDGSPTDPDEATEDDRRAVLAVLEADLGAYPRVEQGTVLLGGSDLAALADLVDTVRATEPEAASRVPITVGTTLDAGAVGFDGPVYPGRAPLSVRLGTGGSTDLVRLAALLRAQPDVGVLELRAPDPDDDEDVRDAGLTAQVAATDLAGGVRRVAEVVAAWSTDLTDLEVGVTAVDPEGRTPGVRLVVERQGDRWVATGGTDHQTEERVAEGVAAWQAGAVTP